MLDGDTVTFKSASSNKLQVGDTVLTKNGNGTYSYKMTETEDSTIAAASFPYTLDQDSDGYFLIKTAEDLQALATYVNGTAERNYKNAHDCDGLKFKLTADITISGTFTPIGWYDYKNQREYSFKGTFDGCDNFITNLQINYTDLSYVGLFGYVEDVETDGKITGGIIKNVNLMGVNISGKNDVGGVVGFNFFGKTEKCTTISEISGTGDNPSNIGGVIGWNNASTVSGNYYYTTDSNLKAVGNSENPGDSTLLYKLTLPEGVTYLSGGYTEKDKNDKVVAVYTAENDYVKLECNSDYLKIGDDFIAKGEDGKFTYEMTATNTTVVPATVLETLEKDSTDGNGKTYLIKTVKELQGLATFVNAGNDCSGKTFKLAPANGDTLDMNGVDFTPIGTETNKFKGTFDGDNKTISNLTITGSNDYVGLFGYLDASGTVQNVNLTGVNISGTSNVGGVVGLNNSGTVSGCTVNGKISGTSNVGGIVGLNNSGTVSNSTNSGTVEGKSNVGGIVGDNSGTVNSDCYYHANTEYTNTEGTPIYKLTLPDDVTASGEGVITVGGGVYAVKDSAVTFNFDANKFYTANIKIGDNNITDTYTVNEDVTVTVKGLEYEGTTVLIKDVADLQMLSDYVGSGHNCAGKTFKLTSSINLTGKNFTPIGVADYSNENSNFAGTFDGNNETVSGLNISLSENCVGLFRANYGIIQNIKVSGTVSGKSNVGGVVGYNSGTTNNCTFNGEISGNNNLGGIVGCNQGSGTIAVTNSSATANNVTVTVENNSVKSITGLSNGGSITYAGKTYKHWIDLPSGVNATGDKLLINNKNYYANGTNITIFGFESGEISFDSSITSLTKNNNDSIAKFGDNDTFTITGLTYPTDSNSWKVEGTDANYGKRYTGGAVINGSKIIYQTPVDEIFVMVTGLKSGVPLTDSNISVDNGKVTIKDAGLLEDGAKISATNNYTVELASTLAPSTSVSKGWNGTSYYSTAGYKTGGWTLSNGKVTQVTATTPTVTITGLKSGVPLTDSNISIGNGKVTIKDAGLLEDGAKISAMNNYTVELANTLNPKKTAANWGELSSGKATYTYASTTEGYTLLNNKVSYTAAVVPKSFTLSGIKSTSGIKVDGTTVTLSATNLNKKTVTISDGYTLKLASDDVTAAVESTATLKTGKYTTAGVKTTGYKLANNKISYLTKNLKTITFSGLTSSAKASDITVSGKKITLGKNAIPTDGTAVSVKTSGYTLTTDNLSEVIISDGGTAKKANYYFATSGTLPTGYVKVTSSDKKTYYVQKDTKFTKAYAEYGINTKVIDDGKTASYMAAAPSGYTKIIDANGTFYTNAITMSAKLTNAAASGKNRVLTAGKESLTVSGAVKKTVEVTAKGILYKAAAGVLTNTSTNAVTITENYNASKGYTASASIKSVSAAKVEENIAINGSKAVQISITGGAGNDSLTGGAGNDYLSGYTGNDTLLGGTGNDTLYGGEGNDSLIGGDGKDTLSGGAGNDTLTSGKGNDLFIYSGGKDVITDYAAGDRISIGAAISNSSVKGSDAIFTINSGTLTIKDGKGKELSFIESNGTERTIIGGAYLADDNSKSNSTLESWREVGDASERKAAIKLVGNAKANTIIGGKGNDTLYGKDGNDYLVGGAGADKLYGQNGNDTLWGGAGNDTLYGGDGKDTFIYKPGEGTDTIFDYQSGDMLQILKSDGSAGGSFTKSSFSGGKLSLTVSGGGKVILDNVSATDTFNINGKTYKINGKTLK